MVLRIVGERILRTVEEEDEGVGGEMDTFAHIARVHALLILVVIGLFDGDIRLRHVAETHLATLTAWSFAMLESARRAARNGELLMGNLMGARDGGDGGASRPSRYRGGTSSSEEEQFGSGSGPRYGSESRYRNGDMGYRQLGETSHRRDPRPDPYPSQSTTKKSEVEALWQAFILSETVRRTWIVCTAVRGSYRMLQDGQLHCGGGIMFTTREGVWDASSAWAWTKLCAEKDVGFMEHAQTKRLFGERRPDEVDAFGKLMLEATYGSERMESWVVSVEG